MTTATFRSRAMHIYPFCWSKDHQNDHNECSVCMAALHAFTGKQGGSLLGSTAHADRQPPFRSDIHLHLLPLPLLLLLLRLFRATFLPTSLPSRSSIRLTSSFPISLLASISVPPGAHFFSSTFFSLSRYVWLRSGRGHGRGRGRGPGRSPTGGVLPAGRARPRGQVELPLGVPAGKRAALEPVGLRTLVPVGRGSEIQT